MNRTTAHHLNLITMGVSISAALMLAGCAMKDGRMTVCLVQYVNRCTTLDGSTSNTVSQVITGGASATLAYPDTNAVKAVAAGVSGKP